MPLPKETDKLLKRKFGEREVIIDPMRFFPYQNRELRQFMAELRAPNSVVLKYGPIKDDETIEDYNKRMNEETTRDLYRRRENETAEEHALRHMTIESKDIDDALPIINKLIEIQNQSAEELKMKIQEPLTQQEFDSARWDKTKEFVFDALNLCGLYVVEYDYKRP